MIKMPFGSVLFSAEDVRELKIQYLLTETVMESQSKVLAEQAGSLDHCVALAGAMNEAVVIALDVLEEIDSPVTLEAREKMVAILEAKYKECYPE